MQKFFWGVAALQLVLMAATIQPVATSNVIRFPSLDELNKFSKLTTIQTAQPWILVDISRTGNAMAPSVAVLRGLPVNLTPGVYAESGIASFYAGGRTANGEYAITGDMTAAHRTLRFGTMVRVTNGINGNSVVVRINDRGPFIAGRVIDLTPAGALALGFSGLAPVTLALADDVI